MPRAQSPQEHRNDITFRRTHGVRNPAGKTERPSGGVFSGHKHHNRRQAAHISCPRMPERSPAILLSHLRIWSRSC
ncbi:hypothetical protein RDSD_000109 [Oleidesulfovibrio alaskensis]